MSSKKITVLIPYCPFAENTGSKVEMLKHLRILRELGDVTIVSAKSKPVGCGWTTKYIAKAKDEGYKLLFREDFETSFSIGKIWGLLFAIIAKILSKDSWFGASNPYHRSAFSQKFWEYATQDADLAIINYSYWSHLETNCPKVVILHDLLMSHMKMFNNSEIADLLKCDCVCVISTTEKESLFKAGVRNLIWSPPLVSMNDFPLSDKIGIIGSDNKFNIEGLEWLQNNIQDSSVECNVYGPLSKYIRTDCKWLKPIGSYKDKNKPYKECGIIIMTTALGMGVQIKAVEALASARAIVARKGAMRGLPDGNCAWLECDTNQQIIKAVTNLVSSKEQREELAARARSYYLNWLDSEKLYKQMYNKYSSFIN